MRLKRPRKKSDSPQTRGLRRDGAGPALGLVLALAYGVPGRADPVDVHGQADAERAVITLVWPRAVKCEPVVRPRELLLRFNRPVEAEQLSSLPQQTAPWILSAQQGYDTVLLVAARDSVFTVGVAGPAIRIEVRGQEHRTAAPPASGPMAAGAARPESLVAAGRTREALRLLEETRAANTNDVPALVALASFENQLGRWRRADAHYGEAQRLQPKNEDVQDARREILAERGSQAGLNLSHETGSGKRTEDRGRAEGQWLHGGLRAGAAVEVVRLDADRAQLTNGVVARFHGDRQAGEFRLQYDTEEGDACKGSLFAAESGLGGGGEWGRPDDGGITAVAGDYRRPYWEVAEAIAGQATRDRLELRRLQRGGERWSAELAGAWNHYSIKDCDDAGTSISLAGNATVRVPAMASGLDLRLQYLLDAEDVQSMASRRRPPASAPAAPAAAKTKTAVGAPPAPATYHPLSLPEREVHGLHGILSYPLLPMLSLEAAVGGEWERESGAGSPYFSVQLVFQGRRWEGGIGYEHRRDYADGIPRDDTLAGSMKLPF